MEELIHEGLGWKYFLFDKNERLLGSRIWSQLKKKSVRFETELGAILYETLLLDAIQNAKFTATYRLSFIIRFE